MILALEKYISELIYNHECVVIPHFGAFLTNYQEPEYHSTTETIYPPRKIITFNPLLKVQDSLLIDYICSETNRPKKDIVEDIRNTIYEWERLLESRKNIVLEKIGKIGVDKKGNIFFEPSYNNNFLTSSYGLESFSIDEFKVNYQEEPYQTVSNSQGQTTLSEAQKTENNSTNYKTQKSDRSRDRKITPKKQFTKKRKPPRKNKRKGFSFIFFLLISIMMGLVFYELYDYGYLDKTINRFYKKKNKQEPLELIKEPISLDTISLDTVVEALSIPEDLPPTTGYISEKKYHIMAGSFKNKMGALNKLQQIKDIGFDNAAYIGVGKKQTHGVAYGSFDDLQQAKELLQMVQGTTDEFAWLLTIE